MGRQIDVGKYAWLSLYNIKLFNSYHEEVSYQAPSCLFMQARMTSHVVQFSLAKVSDWKKKKKEKRFRGS